MSARTRDRFMRHRYLVYMSGGGCAFVVACKLCTAQRQTTVTSLSEVHTCTYLRVHVHVNDNITPTTVLACIVIVAVVCSGL